MSIWRICFGFEGRIRRSQFWLGLLGIVLAAGAILATTFAVMYFTFPETRSGADGWEQSEGLGQFISGGVAIALLVALVWARIAIIVKRWHDRDKSGWMYLILLIPIVGALWTLIECGFIDGTQGQNQYGASPKGIGGDGEDHSAVFA